MKLKELRKLNNMSQQELASLLNVSRSAVAMWESGTEPSHEMLKRLADVFSVTVDYILEREAPAPGIGHSNASGCSDRIRQLRRRDSMSQKELADYLHTHQTAVSQWECGLAIPDARNLEAMSKLFRVSVDYLLCHDDSLVIDSVYTSSEYALLESFRQLNESGQSAALSMIRSLISNPEFAKKEETA